MVAKAIQASINKLYEGGPHMLTCHGANNALKMLSRTLCGFFIGWIMLAELNAQTQSFGSGSNLLHIDFVTVGNPGNPADAVLRIDPPYSSQAFGRVDYIYNISKYEISKDMIDKANINGSLGITYSNLSTQPSHAASNISWFEAAKFVNWLNTSKGYQPAYNFISNSYFGLWDVNKAVSTNNRYRHKNAYYFLPSVDEYYKAAFYDASINYYWRYSNRMDGDYSWTAPTPVPYGTAQNTLVYDQPFPWEGGISIPDIYNEGGLSYYGTMGQSGGVSEWLETSADNVNDNINENKKVAGGNWLTDYFNLGKDNMISQYPSLESSDIGFRVASIPEPSTSSLILFGTIVVFKLKRFYENT